MNKNLFSIVSLTLLAAVISACVSNSSSEFNQPKIHVTSNDRYFEGTLIALHPNTNTMTINAGDTSPNLMQLTYDLHSQFFVDGKPASMIDIRQNMPVEVKAHMTYLHGTTDDGICVIDNAKFSSTIPLRDPPPVNGK